MARLWGENYFDAEAKKWKKDSTSDSGKPLKRAFCAFIMEPIIRLANSIVQGNTEQMDKMLVSIGLELKQEERKEQGKHLLKLVMAKWLNAADTLLAMMIQHLPSPKFA